MLAQSRNVPLSAKLKCPLFIVTEKGTTDWETMMMSHQELDRMIMIGRVLAIVIHCCTHEILWCGLALVLNRCHGNRGGSIGESTDPSARGSKAFMQTSAA